MSAAGSGPRRSTRAQSRSAPVSAVTVWTLGYLVIGVGLATAAVWPLYASPRAILVGLAGGFVGMSLALVVRRLRWGVVLASVAVLGAYLIVAVPLAVPSGLGSFTALVGGLRDAVLGVVVGWKQILTLAPPLGEYQAVLIPFLVVMLFGAYIATLLALHPGRRAASAVAVVAAMSVFGIAFGIAGTSSPLVVLGVVLPAPRELLIGVAVFVTSLAWLVGRARLQRASALRLVAAQSVSRRGAPVWLAVRRHLLSGILIIVALAAGFLVAPAAVGWTDRSVLRDEVEPMIVVREQPSPLSAYRSWFAGDLFGETVMRIDGDPGAIDRVRLVTLDSYDGQDFYVADDTRFSRLPRAAAPGGGRVDLKITIGEAYRGIWLPAPDGLVAAPEFSGSRADALADGFHVDERGDTAITIATAPGGRRGLVPGDSYRVLVDAPADAAGLVNAQGGEPTLEAEEYPALAEWAAMQELPRTGAGYLELIDRLRSRGYLSHGLLADDAAANWVAALKAEEGYSFASSYAGHSAARIEELFASLREQEVRAGADASPEMLVAAVGDDEQFAVAAALLARYWGLESRVVIGARLAAAEGVPGIAPCDEVCTGASMSAWVEVRPAGGEWAAVDVTPQFALLPSTITEGEQLPEHPTVPEQPRSEALDPPQAQSDSQSDAVPLEQEAESIFAVLLPILRGVGIGLLALVLLVLPFLVLLFAKHRRSHSRRRAAEPEVRLAGAWEELADLYADHGISMGARGTRVQRAESAGRPAASALAELVDTGVFAGHPPSEADAATAWALVDRERNDLSGTGNRRQRIAARVRPASFLSRVVPADGVGLRGARLALDTLAVTGLVRDRKKEDA